MGPDLSEYDHPAFVTAVGTVASYTLILVVMFLLLFAGPYLVFLTI